MPPLSCSPTPSPVATELLAASTRFPSPSPRRSPPRHGRPRPSPRPRVVWGLHGYGLSVPRLSAPVVALTVVGASSLPTSVAQTSSMSLPVAAARPAFDPSSALAPATGLDPAIHSSSSLAPLAGTSSTSITPLLPAQVFAPFLQATGDASLPPGFPSTDVAALRVELLAPHFPFVDLPSGAPIRPVGFGTLLAATRRDFTPSIYMSALTTAPRRTANDISTALVAARQRAQDTARAWEECAVIDALGRHLSRVSQMPLLPHPTRPSSPVFMPRRRALPAYWLSSLLSLLQTQPSNLVGATKSS